MAATVEIIAVVITILGLGVAAQVISDRLQVPSVIFLILAGIAVGPEVLGILRPALFGEALSAIVGLSVAIIVFEGAFHLHIERLREAPRETLRLVTIGAFLSLIGEFTMRFGIGVLVGCTIAILVWFLLRHVSLSVQNAPQNARLIVLIASLAMYGLSDGLTRPNNRERYPPIRYRTSMRTVTPSATIPPR